MNSYKKILISILVLISFANSITLQEIYDAAGSGDGYQKLLILNADSIYTGGILQDVNSVCIHGNGAIIDLYGSSITIDGNDWLLDIDHCIIKSSSDVPKVFIEYKNNAHGKIINNTFWGSFNSQDAPICIYFEECLYDSSYIINNIFCNFTTSLYYYTGNSDVFFEGLPLHIEYNLNWQCGTAYLYWAGWTGPPNSFIPIPGNGELVHDPGLINPDGNIFNLSDTSICIDNGRNTDFSYSGNNSDIGARESLISVFRGTRISGYLTHDLVKSNSPYIFIDDVIVNSDQNLKVEPGVSLKFGYLDSIIIYGELQFIGSVNDSIIIENNSCYSIPSGSIHFGENSSSSNSICYCRFIDDCSISCYNDSVTIENCLINGNMILCENYCKAKISYNTIRNSSIRIASLSSPLINNNILAHSSVYSDSSCPRIIANRFLGQEYFILQHYWLITLSNKSNAYIESNYFTNNYGAILVKDTSSVISVNNLVIGCDNAILFVFNSFGLILNNTIYSEGRGPFSYHDGYGIICDMNSMAVVINSIVWNIGEWSKALRTHNSSEIITQNCVLSTFFEGEEIIYDDPIFINPDSGDFHLSSGSPCINSGKSDTLVEYIPKYDFDGNPRIIDSFIDIGCFEYQSLDKIDTAEMPVTNKFNLKQNYPNPFNSVTKISYRLRELSNVNISIFDICGRTIINLIDEVQEKGKYNFIWDAKELQSGIYMIKMEANNFCSVKKCVLVK